MSLKASLPSARQAVIEQGGTASRPYYVFLQAVASAVDALAPQAGDVTTPAVSPLSPNANVSGAFSIYTQGALKAGIVRVLLLGDVQTPGNTQYYGSDGTGERGWFNVSDALASTADITRTVGTDGVTTLGLADLADSGTGAALLKITRDAKGRVSGTQAATTADLTEGANLYFTNARASAAAPVQSWNGRVGAVVPASGDYTFAQLASLPTTLAGYGITDAATAAQGAKADSALQDAPSDGSTYGRKNGTWSAITTGGAVSSVFGRTGVVVASTGDYTFAQIGSTPTTLTGYGITDAVPATRTVNGKALSANVTLSASDVSAEPTITAGTTSQFWRGDKTWQDFATAVRATVLTGLSTATSAVIAATDTVLGALGKLQAQITDNLLPPGYIDGLQMQWVSGTALTVSSGAAYIQGSSKVLRAPSAIAKTGLSLTASTWCHVYLYDNAGTPAVEVVTTAPATAYSGTARCKTGDTGRRYVGSVRTDSSGNVIRFDHSLANGSVYYLTNINNAPLPVLSAGAATSATDVDMSAAIPITSRRAIVYSENNNPSGGIAFITAPPLNPLTDVITFLRPTSYVPGTYLTSSAQKVSYAFNVAPAAGTGLFMWVLGYEYER